jgi:hypothetical protein
LNCCTARGCPISKGSSRRSTCSIKEVKEVSKREEGGGKEPAGNLFVCPGIREAKVQIRAKGSTGFQQARAQLKYRQASADICIYSCDICGYRSTAQRIMPPCLAVEAIHVSVNDDSRP